MKRYLPLLKKIVIGVIGLYVAFCALVFFYPRLFFYNPYSTASDIEKARKDGLNAVVRQYKAEDGTEVFGWYAKPKNGNGKIIVFMHGNSYNLEKFYPKVLPLFKDGYAVFMAEYRGFGGIAGKISQKNLEQDAIAAVRQAQALGYKNSDIIVYGFSLGTYLAANSVWQLQDNENFAALILEAPFDNLISVSKDAVPLPLPFETIIRDRYDTSSIIDKINTRLLVMSGTEDPTVPCRLSEKLYNKAVTPKKMIIYEGGRHSNLYDYKNYNDILVWLKQK